MLWYNNCNESLNNVIKRKINWEVQQLPNLISKLHELEQDQIRDIRGALHDTGKYSLSQSACILKVSHDNWFQLTSDQRSRRVHTFLNNRPKQTDIISSTDGQLTVPCVAKVAHKPGQRRRVKKTLKHALLQITNLKLHEIPNCDLKNKDVDINYKDFLQTNVLTM